MPPYSLSTKMFSGFRSLCTIPMLWQYDMPWSTYLMIPAASCSLKVILLTISSKSSPPLQYSVTRKYFLESSKTSYNFRIFGWSNLFRVAISYLKLSSSSLLIDSFLMILTALISLLVLLTHFLTSPKAPVPST